MAFNILVVDNSITIQKIVVMAFEKEDALVEGISNGSEALEKIKKFKPNIVLADVDMPGLNGFELSKKIKESSELDSVSVLLLTSDFEDFNEDLFRDSRADDHITKPFKSEDIVGKVMELLNGTSGSAPMEDDEAENVITLSRADQVEEETVVELGKDQLMNSTEEISLEDDQVHLELSDHDMPGALVNPEHEELVVELEGEEDEDPGDYNLSEDDPAATVNSSGEEPPESDEDLVKSEQKVPEKTLDELVRRVQELSKKSEEIREQRSSEEVQPLEALDEMIKEVHSLKKVSSATDQEGNGTAKGSFPPDTTQVDTVVAEVNYISEENAEELEAAFNEIIGGNKHFSPSFTASPSEQTTAVSEDKEIVPEPEILLRDLQAHPFATSLESSVQNPKVETHPHFSEEDQPPEEKNMETEENFENMSESQNSQEELFDHLMEKEVRKIIEQSLTSSIEKEISGLSEKIFKSVEEIVREIIPGIAKTMIEKEIDKVKNKKTG